MKWVFKWVQQIEFLKFLVFVSIFRDTKNLTKPKMEINQKQVKKTQLIFAVVIIMYCIQCYADNSGCGEIFSTRMDQNVFGQHRLRTRVFQSQPISTPLECYVNCMKDCRCVSYNVCKGGKFCELNSQKKADNISLYEASDECDYHEYEFSKLQVCYDETFCELQLTFPYFL